jgi:tight adherence protein B
VLSALGVAGFVRALFEEPEAWKKAFSTRARLSAVAASLAFVRWPLSALGFRLVQFSLVLFGLLGVPLSPYLGGFCLLSILPPVLLARAVRTRREKIESQIEGWMSMLARGLEAEPSLGEAIETTATLCDAPIAEELRVVVAELALGHSLERALRSWAHRVESPVLTLSLAIVEVGRQTGGRMGEVLKQGAATLREMERLEGVIRTKTAEGKAQAWVIAILPFPVIYLIHLGDPEYFVPLQTTFTGYIIIAIAAALWIASIFAARKILAVDI